MILKKISHLTGFLLGSLFLCNSWNCQAQVETPADPALPQATDTATIAVHSEPPTQTSRNYTVIGVGDMMLGTNYPSASYLPPKGGADLLSDVAPLLRDADVTFGNLEGTLLDKGGTAKRCKNPEVCYAFRSPESYGQHFADAGFDFLSLANNHSGDFGPTGRLRTKQTLDRLGIAYSGLAGTDEVAIIERAGKKWGLASFAPNRGTTDIRQLARAATIVRQLSEQCDFVLVSFHGGAEGAKNQHVPRRTETYYGENRGDVYQFARTVIDAGADVVFGHGPHVTRAADLYKDRFIIYSLGNFCTYGRFNLRGVAGIAPLIKISLNEEGAFQRAEVTSVYQQKTHGPKVDPEARAYTVLQSLTEADFPHSSLRFHSDGIITVAANK